MHNVILIAMTMMMCVGIGFADVPRELTFQGKLTGNGTDPVSLKVRFWDAATGGNLLWSETHPSVPRPNGLFSINIGSQSAGGIPDTALDYKAFDPNATGVWLGISINDESELSPRASVGLVPYAAKATMAEGLVSPGTFHEVGTIDGGELHIVPDPADYPAGLKIGSSDVGASNMTIRLSHPSGGYVRVQAHKNYGTQYGDIALNADGGRVGIGTTAPATKLHVHDNAGVLLLEGNDHCYIEYFPFGLAAGRQAYLGFGAAGGGDFTLANETNGGDIYLNTRNTGYVIMRGDAGARLALDLAGATRLSGGMDSLSAGRLVTYGPNGSENCSLGSTSNAPNHGYIAARDSAGSIQAGIYVDTSGNGIVFGDTKSFRAPNPDDPRTEIWYACIEGPEAAAYVRGTGALVNGQAVIELPDHFQAVATQQGMTVQLTPLSADSLGLAVVEKSLDTIVVRELQRGTGSYSFDYLVHAVRKGHEDYRVIRPAVEGLPASGEPRAADNAYFGTDAGDARTTPSDR